MENIFVGHPLIMGEKMYNMLKTWKPDAIDKNPTIGWYKGKPVNKNEAEIINNEIMQGKL